MSFTSETIDIKITPEAITKYRGARAEDGLLQAIYNSIDANAKKISIMGVDDEDYKTLNLEDNETIIDKIIITDDGEGIAYKSLKETFQNFEKSWKENRIEPGRRPYHGKFGCGRFKYFALGNNIQWQTTYEENGKFYSYKMSLESNNPTQLYVSSPHEVFNTTTQTIVTIKKLTNKARNIFSSNKLRYEICAGILLDLQLNVDLCVFLQNEPLIPNEYIQKTVIYENNIEGAQGNAIKVKCQVIAWKNDVQFTDHKHSFYYTNEGAYVEKHPSGFPADQRLPSHTLIFQSSIFNKYSPLEAKFNSIFVKIEKAFSSQILAFLTEVRNVNLGKALSELINTESYPFKKPVNDPLEDALKTAYNACLYSLLYQNNSLLSKKRPKNLKTIFELLKKVLNHDDLFIENAEQILSLDSNTQLSLRKISACSKLSKIIARYDKLRHRKTFLEILDRLVHQQTLSQHIEERTQLHKILNEEVWIFGDNYDTEDLITSDKTVVTLIRELAKRDDLIFNDNSGNDALEKIEDYIKTNRSDLTTCLNKIPDLVLCKKFSNFNQTQRKFLIIELKKPTVIIDNKSRNQALEIYTAISKATRNGGGLEISSISQWRYCLISSAIDENLKHEFDANQHLESKEQGNYVIDCLIWRDIIDKAHERIEAELKGLQISVQEDDCKELLDHYKQQFGITESRNDNLI